MNLSTNNLIHAIPDIEQLSIILRRFNPFKVLKIDDVEIRHSNMLVWLMSPHESHGFRDRFFKDYIIKVLNSSENESRDDIDENIHSIILSEFNNVTVLREQNKIDILCICHINKLVVLIENKVKSGEHSDQLNRYLGHITNQYSGYRIIPILLSIEGVAPTSVKYLASSYKQVIETIDHLLSVYKDNLTSSIRDFICHYKNIVEEKTMTDPNLLNIAKKIYKENKEAIDLIYSVGNSIDICNAFDQFMKAHGNITEISKNPSWITFITSDMKVVKKPNTTSDWGNGFPSILWLAPYYGKLKLCIEVGPFDSGKQRLEYLLMLEKNGVKIKESSKVETGTYTRLWTNTIDIKDWQDTSELTQKMNDLYGNKELKNIHSAVVKSIGEATFFK
jgi:hypothetical protein